MKVCGLLFVTLGFCAVVNAQNLPIGPVSVGQTSSIQTATLTFTSPTIAGSPFTINVLKQGSSGLDFNFANGGNCSPTATYNAGDTCTVNYTFSPLHPGFQTGAVSLTVGSTALATTYISGVGNGPQIKYFPPQQDLLGVIGGAPSAIAVDGAGDVFVAEFFGPVTGLGGEIAEIPKGCTNASCVVDYIDPSQMFPVVLPQGTVGSDPTAIAIDGAGNLYVGFGVQPQAAFETALFDTPIYEFPRGCTSDSCAIPIGSGMSGTFAVAVDGSGNIYASTSGEGNNNLHVSKISPGCTSASCVTTISANYPVMWTLAPDQYGNVFFVADAQNGVPGSNSNVLEIPNGCTDSSCVVSLVTPATTATSITGVTTDGLGNLFYTDDYDLYEIPVGCNTSSCYLTLHTGYDFISGPVMATDGSNNVYAMDYDAGVGFVYELDLTDPPTVTFPMTTQGDVSSQQTLTVSNNGNQPLLFTPSTSTTNPTISQYFQLDTTSPGTCGALISSSTTPTLAPMASCTLPISFAPLSPADGTTNGTLTLSDSNLNVTAATQNILLTGDAALPGQTSTALSSSLNASYIGQSVTFTAQITSLSGTPTGSVIFADGATTLATVALNSTGTASTTDSALTAGTHTITATYAPTGSFLASNATLSQQVNSAVAVDVLTVNPYPVNPVLIGSTVTLTATVTASPAGGTPTGTVTFTSAGSNLATVLLVGGVATYSTSSLPAGTDTLSCVYSGDSNFAGTNCQSVGLTVDSQATPASITLTSSANPAAPYTTVSFTGVLSATPRQRIGSDSVALSIDGTAFGSQTTNAAGEVVFPVQGGLAPGQHTITVTSSAIGIYASAMASLTETVNQAASSSTLTVTPATASAGLAETLTAAVGGSLNDTVNGTTLSPTGTVTFSSNGTALSTVSLTNGVASYTTTALPIGTDNITCTYSGDSNFAASSCNSIPVTINAIASTITVSSSANPSPAFSPITFTATLQGGSTPLSGNSVTLSIDGAAIGTKTTNAQGAVSFADSGLSPGQHTVTVSSAAQGNYGSTTATLNQTVNLAGSAAVLAVAPTMAAVGSAVTMTATISNSSSGSSSTAIPTGTVTFSSNGTALSTVTLANGAASYTTTALPIGTDSVSCTYSGDANFASSNCNSATVAVSLIASSLAVTPSANPSPALSPVTFSATLLGGSAPLSGASVVLSIDNTAVATIATNAQGVASYTASSLNAGQHAVTASFAGSGNYAGAQSAPFNQQVQSNPTTTTLSASPNPVQQGQPLAVSVSVSATQGTAAPTGSIALLQGTTQLATATLTTPTSGVVSTATITVSSLPAGSDSIEVNYTPADENFVASSSSLSTVTVDVPDFSIAANPTSLNIETQRSGSATVNVTSLAGFAGSVQIACGSGLPEYLSCSMAQSSLSLAANGTASTLLTLNTMQGSNTARVHPSSKDNGGIWWALLLPFSLLPFARQRRVKKVRSVASMMLILSCLGGIFTSLTGCGSHSADSTPPGTYSVPIVVSVTNNGSSSPTSHTLNLSVTITQ